MGVYINMEMPRNCNECRFAIENYCYAVVKYKHLRGGERKNWCPLIEVPPHGDLIDRDKLREKEFIHVGDAYAVVMSRDIRNAPTIIPADEG